MAAHAARGQLQEIIQIYIRHNTVNDFFDSLIHIFYSQMHIHIHFMKYSYIQAAECIVKSEYILNGYRSWKYISLETIVYIIACRSCHLLYE